ncbi:LysM peptidoglycan-binding domain-containing protein [Bacillus sp. REN16]|uniref:LysM peptidoglycan-binding domain-containing protein n=1 Tax=Bacillus sp. REN16 TaxID=2887296 RepID=UPI001E377AE8|nr:LysM peptidoglycan-binding domain-containing protein [Bacillus sp. REN16]MCC3358288.1 LysM peptidoglycan-binding domain-containing protein [Bacillus sp. REN16]
MKQPEGEEKSVEIEKSTSGLPPRSEFHKTKKKKTKVKIKYPIIRLLALLFVLLPVAILSYKFNPNPSQLESAPVKKSANFESISYEDEDDKIKAPETVKQEEPNNVEQEANVVQEEPDQSQTEKQEEVLTSNQSDQNVAENNSPPATEAAKQPVQKQEKPKDQYDVKYHKVQAEENLYRISMKYYNSRSGEELIRRWNNLNGDTVIEGQVLQIPIKIN